MSSSQGRGDVLSMSRGYSLVEAIMVVAILAMTAASFAPAARRYHDSALVVAARESVVGLIAAARLRALGKGNVAVHLGGDPFRVWVVEDDSVLLVRPLGNELGVSLELSRGRNETRLAYDALALGRVASETLTFVRGNTRRSLIVSGYGRVRRP